MIIARILRIVAGFALACVAAALTLVLFVYAPGDLSRVGDELDGERLSEIANWALIITPHVAVSAAFPAMLAAVIAEQRKIGNWAFYVLAGMATALAGFLAQSLLETPGERSILHTYALIAFLSAGLVGGLVYWLASGRYAAAPAPRAGGPKAAATP
jgi:hypothetical protein